MDTKALIQNRVFIKSQFIGLIKVYSRSGRRWRLDARNNIKKNKLHRENIAIVKDVFAAESADDCDFNTFPDDVFSFLLPFRLPFRIIH